MLQLCSFCNLLQLGRLLFVGTNFLWLDKLLSLEYCRKSSQRSITKGSTGCFGGRQSGFAATIPISFFTELIYFCTEISCWWVQCHCCHINWWRRPGYNGSWSCHLFWCKYFTDKNDSADGQNWKEAWWTSGYPLIFDYQSHLSSSIVVIVDVVFLQFSKIWCLVVCKPFF